MGLSSVDLNRTAPLSTSSYPVSPADVGLLKSTILPSFYLHSGLSLATYAISRATDRVEGKDWLWPSGQVINVWWHAVGQRVVYNDVSLRDALRQLTWSEKLLLTGVTAWGVRLFYRIASRSLSRGKGKDDPRYEAAKKEPGFWNKAFFKLFVPEVLFQTLISLSFTVPFRVTHGALPLAPKQVTVLRALGVGLFSAGFGLEVLADAQVAAHRERKDDLCSSGVWSIVRHPNYLGDTLIHVSFPFLSASEGPFYPVTLLGPLANYFFLRHIGGDKQTENSQEERYAEETDIHKFEQLLEARRHKNSFWPGLAQLSNPWLWGAVGAGVAGIAVEEGFRVLWDAASYS